DGARGGNGGQRRRGAAGPLDFRRDQHAHGGVAERAAGVVGAVAGEGHARGGDAGHGARGGGGGGVAGGENRARGGGGGGGRAPGSAGLPPTAAGGASSRSPCWWKMECTAARPRRPPAPRSWMPR